MARIIPSSNGSSPFQNLLGHNPTVLNSWNQLEEAFFSSSSFSQDLKEEVRRTLAHLNRCHYCMAKGCPAESIEDQKTQRAVDLAKAIWKDQQDVSETMIEELKVFFSDAEISELCAFICFICASQKFGAALGLEASCGTTT